MDCDYYHDTWDPRSLSYCSSHRDSYDGGDDTHDTRNEDSSDSSSVSVSTIDDNGGSYCDDSDTSSTSESAISSDSGVVCAQATPQAKPTTRSTTTRCISAADVNTLFERKGGANPVKDKKGKKRLTVLQKLKMASDYIEGKEPSEINEWATAKELPTATRSQLIQFVRDFAGLHEAALQSPHGMNLRGAGRPVFVDAAVSATVVKMIEDRRRQGRRTTADTVRALLAEHTDVEITDFVLAKFIKDFKIVLRAASNGTAESQTDTDRVLQGFHEECAKLNSFLSLQASDIVQLDEMCGSLSGLMRPSKTRHVVGVDQKIGKSANVHTCALDDTKKIATVIGFISTAEIPPIVIFKGKGLPSLKERSRYPPGVHFLEGGNTTQAFYRDVIIPHIKKYVPGVRVIIHDSASSHKGVVKQAGLWELCIPKHCTQFVQALDVYFFHHLRMVHHQIMHALVESSPPNRYARLSSTGKRLHFVHLCHTAYALVASTVDCTEIFTKLGYLKPSAASVLLTKLPEYQFQEIAEAELAKRLVELRRRVEEKKQVTRNDVCAAATAVATKELPTTKEKKPEDVVVPPKKEPGRPKKQQPLDPSQPLITTFFTRETPAKAKPQKRDRSPRSPTPVAIDRSPVKNHRWDVMMSTDALRTMLEWQHPTYESVEVVTRDAVQFSVVRAMLQMRESPLGPDKDTKVHMWICNTDVSWAVGRHWVLLSMKQGTIVVFDSLLDNRGTAQLLEELHLNYRVHFVQTGLQTDSTTCGAWSLSHLHILTKYGLTDYEGTISNFADIVKREFTEQDSLQTPRQYCESNFQFKGGLI